MNQVSRFLAVVGVLLSVAVARADITSYWDFNSNNGAMIDDLVPDSTHDGTLTGSAQITSGASGFGGGEALQPGADGYLRVTHPSLYDFNDDFTWHAYVKTDEGLGNYGIIGRAPEQTPYNEGSKILSLRNGSLQLDAGGVGQLAVGGTLDDDTWHQIIVTYNAMNVPSVGGEGGNGLLAVYLDGAPLVINQTFNLNRYDEHNRADNGGVAESGLRIGSGSQDFIANAFPGLIDEVAVFDRELTGTDLNQLINQGPGSFLPNMLTWDSTNSRWAGLIGGKSHWSGGSTNAIPDATNPIIVNGGTATIVDNRAVYSAQINGGTVQISITGNLDVERHAHVASSGTLQVDGGFFADSLTVGGTVALGSTAVSVVDVVNVNGGMLTAETSLFVDMLHVAGGSVDLGDKTLTIRSRLSTLADGQHIVANVALQGTLDIVNGPGTLNIDGALTMQNGSSYTAELHGASADRISVSGDVDLNAAPSLRLAIDGANPFLAGSYTLVESTGGTVSGEFDSLTKLNAYVTDGGLTYEENAVVLTLDMDLHPGDADLNGSTDLSDFNTWNANKFISGTEWTSGDFNGDGGTDLSDFNIWNSAKFTSADGIANSTRIDVFYDESTGELTVDTNGASLISLLVQGPPPESVDCWTADTFEDGAFWAQDYFAGKEQWGSLSGQNVPDGTYQLATYASGLTAADFGQIEFGMADGQVAFVGVQVVPEPAVVALLACALLGWLPIWLRRRKR